MSARPPLPLRHANPRIPAALSSGVLPPVKYQILNCQGQDILVGRMKIETPTPSGHAFILRRFDTGAISLTTMFRAAFPNAPDNEEKIELQWVKENYDLSGNNGGPHNPQITRLAGTWVSPSLARTIGDSYALGDLITAVVEATPDPNAVYRRSGKAAATANSAVTSPAAPTISLPAGKPVSPSKPVSRALPTPSPTAAPNPAKRRKESSPAPAPAPPSPVKAPVLRRSTRTKSPAPRSTTTIAPLTSVLKTPKATKLARQEEVLTPGASDDTAVEEEGEVVEDGVTGSELRQQDITEQQELIDKLKKQRDAALGTVVVDEASQETEVVVDGSAKLKRSREEQEETLQFNFKEPEVGERVIATNSRVSRFQMEPRTKSFVWGVAAFAFGLSAVSLLPSLF